MITLLVILYILVCLFLIMVVLLQQGKGADLAGAFGGGGTQTAFGPRSGTTLMHKLTTGSFVLFIVLSMTLAILQGKSTASSVMDTASAAKPTPAAETPAEAAPAKKAEEPTGQTPAAATQKQEAPAQPAPAQPAPAQKPAGGQTGN
ncbi:MAG: preprotein translocase subunit SecG [Acidobacteria bacterium]|nr:preprotein translocase subunit SecG [Acidobacteriota bacterium]